MFFQPPRERECWSWSFAILWTIGIFCFIPIARAFQRAMENAFGREAFLVVVFAYLALLLMLAFLVLFRSFKRLPLANVCWLVFFLSILGYWSWQLRSYPERALHFVQYGTLSILLYRALLYRFRDYGIFLVSVALCLLVGTVDEIAQWFTPERYFDYDDILVNGGAAILMQLAIATGIRPTILSSRISAAPLRVCLSVFGFQCCLLALCFSNTPRVVRWYTSYVPALSYLQEKPNLMAEYGYRYVDPEIGTFFSRLRVEELAHWDRERGIEAGQLVHTLYDTRLYDTFLRRYPAHTFPLHYELRVRLFRRDAYWGDAMKASVKSASFRDAITIAYREHQILERYYPLSYQASRRKLSDDDAEWMKNSAIAEYHYTSPVGGHLLTYLSQLGYLSMFATLLAVILWTLRSPLRPVDRDCRSSQEVES